MPGQRMKASFSQQRQQQHWCWVAMKTLPPCCCQLRTKAQPHSVALGKPPHLQHTQRPTPWGIEASAGAVDLQARDCLCRGNVHYDLANLHRPPTLSSLSRFLSVRHCLLLSFPSFSLTLQISRARAHTHIHARGRSLFLSHTHCYSNSHTHSLSLKHTHTLLL